MDQDIANWVLLAKPGQTYYHRHLDWGTWPRNLATGLLEDVNTNETAAFHAIFVSGIGPKLGRIAEGIVRGQARVPACAPHPDGTDERVYGLCTPDSVKILPCRTAVEC
jgi:hypothetical protein